MLHPVGGAPRCTSCEVALDRFRCISGGCDSSRTAPASLTSEVIEGASQDASHLPAPSRLRSENVLFPPARSRFQRSRNARRR